MGRMLDVNDPARATMPSCACDEDSSPLPSWAMFAVGAVLLLGATLLWEHLGTLLFNSPEARDAARAVLVVIGVGLMVRTVLARGRHRVFG